MTTRNLELKELPDLLPSREGARKQLRNGGGVLYAMFEKYSFQKSNYYRFTNTPLQPHSLPAPSQEGNKNQIADNHNLFPFFLTGCIFHCQQDKLVTLIYCDLPRIKVKQPLTYHRKFMA
jgi:hypothetical protein